MSLIKKPAEIIGKEVIAGLIYGQPGTGKTTLACSAPAPVLLDFDGGAVRIRDDHQVPTVQIASFDEALQALDEIQADGSFKTIIVDTASKMIDSITTSICGNAQPQIKQWGMINAKFKSFLRAVQSMQMNIIFIAQREVEKDGEETRYIPQFRASNYKDVICDLDICGYVEISKIKGKDQRVITFNPSARSEGKNTANFAPSYILPELAEGQPNNFLTLRIHEFINMQRARMERKLAVAQEVEKQFTQFMQRLEGCTTADELNALCDEVKDAQPVGDLKAREARAISTRAANLGIKFNKEGRRYV